jgi:hypothetical protein
LASSINASTTAGVVTTADTSGVLNIQTAGTTAISIDASQAVSFTNAPTVTGGTANGVAYLNGSKVLTTGSALTFDGSKLVVNTASDDILRLTATAPYLSFYNGATRTGYIRANTSGTFGIVSEDASTPMAFYTAGAEQMRLSISGNLGLGVTPSAWNSIFKAIDTGTTASFAGSSGGANVFNNAYWNGSNYIYKTTAGAARYLQSLNEHLWFNAPSGTAGNAITFTQAMTLDASGNLGIGTTSPAAKAEVVSSTGAQFIGTFRTGDSTAANNSGCGFYGVSSATAGSRQASMWLDADGANFAGGDYFYILKTGNSGNVDLIQASNAAITFQTNTTERARITSAGDLLVGTTTSGGKCTVVNPTNATFTMAARTTQSSGSDAYGIASAFPNFSPNNTSSFFFYGSDSAAVRFEVRANGGIANFSANDVNLSDRREKTNFAPAGSYLDKICAIPVQTFNYIDQNLEEDAGLTLGVVAQDVQAVAPELVMESNWGTKEEPKMRLSIYQTDLQYALMKCIQEQQALIIQLTARITALESA